ncbi:hypothetical protein V6N11_025373 [Hibiscus sabdariffa]|uniref:Uncharacterized protein n=2 Tax=Hibiscus sabdariffa TaxID=183260 RepID=A0ABR2B2S0_9ROSI
MRSSTLTLQISPTPSGSNPHQPHHKLPTIFRPLPRTITAKSRNNRRLNIRSRSTPPKTTATTDNAVIQGAHRREGAPTELSRFVAVGAVSMGLALLLMDLDVEKALALGPEGPLVEEFWDNVRRYALYALTASASTV